MARWYTIGLMPRGELHKVGGRQAREALEHGWVKVDKATAARLFAAGMSVTITGTRVHPAHLGRLGTTLDPARLGAGVSFERLLEGLERELEVHPSLGYGVAFFVPEGEWPVMPRGARDRMPSSEEPRVMPRELRGAEWLQNCGAVEPDVALRQRHLGEPPRRPGRPGRGSDAQSEIEALALEAGPSRERLGGRGDLERLGGRREPPLLSERASRVRARRSR
jgi:hypothetical protein